MTSCAVVKWTLVTPAYQSSFKVSRRGIIGLLWETRRQLQYFSLNIFSLLYFHWLKLLHRVQQLLVLCSVSCACFVLHLLPYYLFLSCQLIIHSYCYCCCNSSPPLSLSLSLARCSLKLLLYLRQESCFPSNMQFRGHRQGWTTKD